MFEIEFEFDDIKSLAPSEQKAVKSVRFARHDRVRKIPHIDDLTDDEIDAVWMHPEDFKDIRKECKTIILVLEHDPDLVEGIEIRGLEQHMLHQKNQAQATQKLLYDTVHRLQKFADDSGMDVSDMIASMCNKISSEPEAYARQTALKDEEQVEP